MVAAGGVIVGGTEGVGLDLAQALDRLGTEAAGRNMGDLSQRAAIGGEVRLGGRSTGGLNTSLKGISTRVNKA